MTAAGQETGGVTGTSLSSRRHLWGEEDRGRGDARAPPKPITCWRKRWGKDLGDITLKSGRLSRGEPP